MSRPVPTGTPVSWIAFNIDEDRAIEYCSPKLTPMYGKYGIQCSDVTNDVEPGLVWFLISNRSNRSTSAP